MDQPFSEQTAALVDAEVQRIIGECHAEAKWLLREHRKALDGLVGTLLEKETVSEEEVLKATGLPPAAELEEGPLSG
jgi:cell division protease FtsH